MAVPNPKFELYDGSNGKVRWRLKAKNGQVILVSQAYAAKAGAKKGIASVQKNCGDDACYEKKTAKDGQHYFNLVSTNQQVIGTSEMYTSAAARDKGIASVKANGSTENIEDLTG